MQRTVLAPRAMVGRGVIPVIFLIIAQGAAWPEPTHADELAPPEYLDAGPDGAWLPPALPVAPSASVAQAWQEGEGNGIAIVQSGNDHHASVRQRGDDNQASILQQGSGHDATLTQEGNGNTFSLTQSGNGQRLDVMQWGDGLSVQAAQR